MAFILEARARRELRRRGNTPLHVLERSSREHARRLVGRDVGLSAAANVLVLPLDQQPVLSSAVTFFGRQEDEPVLATKLFAMNEEGELALRETFRRIAVRFPCPAI